MCLGFGKKKRERERKSEGKDTELFPPFFSLSLFRVHGTNNFVSRETRHNKKRHDATLCLQHKARVLPARKLSRRNPPRRRDGASSSTRVVFGARILSLPFFRLLHFCALQIGKMSLWRDDGRNLVATRKRARASFFARRRRRRVVEGKGERAVASGRGGSSIQSSVFFFGVVSLTLFGRIVLSLFSIVFPKQIGF